MTTDNSIKSSPEYQSREITATIGELHRSTWDLMDMKDVLQSNIQDEGVQLGVLTPSGQELMFSVISRVLSRQSEMLDHLQNTLEIKQIDWEDLYVGKIDAQFDIVSSKNKDEEIERKIKGRGANGEH